MRRVLLSLGALGLTWSLVSPIAAGADDPLGCGEVVTRDTVLDHDITDCQGDGLVIGADNVTLDLNGHYLRGRMNGEEAPDTEGISIRGRHGVTIEGGGHDESVDESVIEGFEIAVRLSRSADNNRVRGLRLRGSVHGVVLYDSDNNRIDDNVFAFAGGEYPAPCVPGAEGAIALFNSHNNRVRRNETHLGLFGIVLVRSDKNRLENNESAPEWSDGNACDGIALFNSDRNRVVGNTVANNPKGIMVAANSKNNVVEKNLAFQNWDDGIEVNNRTTTVKGNEANNNHGLGINAVRGVKDGGRNRASANGDPAQCQNVACS